MQLCLPPSRGSVSIDRHSEIALIVAVNGCSDYYTVQWAEREATAVKPPSTSRNASRDLQPIRFCRLSLVRPNSCTIKG
jgi:hypothetical protein